MALNRDSLLLTEVDTNWNVFVVLTELQNAFSSIVVRLFAFLMWISTNDTCKTFIKVERFTMQLTCHNLGKDTHISGEIVCYFGDISALWQLKWLHNSFLNQIERRPKSDISCSQITWHPTLRHKTFASDQCCTGFRIISASHYPLQQNIWQKTQIFYWFHSFQHF